MRKSLERLSNAEIYEDDILAIDKILSMTGFGHQYKDTHRYIQTLTNDLQRYGNLKLAIKNLEKKINLNSKRKTRRHKQIKNKSTIKELPKKKIDNEIQEIKMNNTNRNTKYDQTINVPEDIELESACSNYNNGILEITFKKERKKQKSRQIDT